MEEADTFESSFEVVLRLSQVVPFHPTMCTSGGGWDIVLQESALPSQWELFSNIENNSYCT